MSLNTVSTSTYDQRVDELDKLCKEIIAEKRPVYTHSTGDTLRNFRVNAIVANSTVGQALTFGLVKQLNAVVDLLTDANSTDTERDNRFADARNYLDLAYVAYKEGQLHERV